MSIANSVHQAPTAGERAPDAALPSADGTTARLSELWQASGKGLVLVFLRHFGCIFCRQHAKELCANHAEFERRAYNIVAIGHGTPKRAQAFQAEMNLPFPVFGDWERVAYAAYGLGEAKVTDMLQPRLYMAFAKATLAGSRSGRPDGDVRQLPGTFIIDPSGIVRFAKPAGIASDIASTGELLAWIDRNEAAR